MDNAHTWNVDLAYTCTKAKADQFSLIHSGNSGNLPSIAVMTMFCKETMEYIYIYMYIYLHLQLYDMCILVLLYTPLSCTSMYIDEYIHYIYIFLSLCYWYHMYFWWQKFPPPLPFLRGHGVNLIHQKPGARREQDSKTKLEFVLVLSREWGNDPKSLVIIIPAAPIPIHSLLSTSKNWIIEN